MKATAMVPLKNGSAIHLFAAAPARIASEIRLRPPRHQNLAIVFFCLRDKAGFIALDRGGLLHQVWIPGLAHSGRLRKLRGGDGLELAARLTLHHAMNAFRAADVGDAEARDCGARAETVDLFIDGHQREKIRDAVLGWQIWILKWVVAFL